MPYVNKIGQYCGFLDYEDRTHFVRRFFILDINKKRWEYYMDNPQNLPAGSMPSGTFNVQFLSLVGDASKSRPKVPFCFYVVFSGTKNFFRADDQAEKDLWITVLTDAAKVTVSVQSSSKISTVSTEAYRAEIYGGVLHKTKIAAESNENSNSSDDSGLTDKLPCPNMNKSDVLFQGYCIKQGVRRKNWLKRYFILTVDGLSYYKTAQDTSSINHINRMDIVDARVSVGIYTNKEHLFEVVTPYRVFYLQAESQSEMNSWITHINSLVHMEKKPPVFAEQTIIEAEGKRSELNNQDTNNVVENISNKLQPASVEVLSSSATVSSSSNATVSFNSGPSRIANYFPVTALGPYQKPAIKSSEETKEAVSKPIIISRNVQHEKLLGSSIDPNYKNDSRTNKPSNTTKNIEPVLSKLQINSNSSTENYTRVNKSHANTTKNYLYSEKSVNFSPDILSTSQAKSTSTDRNQSVERQYSYSDAVLKGTPVKFSDVNAKSTTIAPQLQSVSQNQKVPRSNTHLEKQHIAATFSEEQNSPEATRELRGFLSELDVTMAANDALRITKGDRLQYDATNLPVKEAERYQQQPVSSSSNFSTKSQITRHASLMHRSPMNTAHPYELSQRTSVDGFSPQWHTPKSRATGRGEHVNSSAQRDVSSPYSAAVVNNRYFLSDSSKNRVTDDYLRRRYSMSTSTSFSPQQNQSGRNSASNSKSHTLHSTSNDVVIPSRNAYV